MSFKIPVVFSLPEPETKPCDFCNQKAIINSEGHAFCDECREYFKNGFGILVK